MCLSVQHEAMLRNMDFGPRHPKSLFIVCLQRQLNVPQFQLTRTPTVVLVKLENVVINIVNLIVARAHCFKVA